MNEQRQAEYEALRATIRERGTARVVLFGASLTLWAALITAVSAVVPVPAAALVPLMVLVAAFEAVYSLHVGVERVGRYLQVFHGDGWELTAMAYGQRFPGGGTDALFAAVFWMATAVNLFPLVLVTPTLQEVVPIGLAHLLFMARVYQARRRAAGLRNLDLDRFRALAANPPPH